MANKTIETLIAINRSLVEIMHRRGLLPVGGAQMLLKDLADAAKNIEQTAKVSAARAVNDVKKAVDKEAARVTAKVKASVKGKPAKKAAAKKPAAKKAAPKKAAKKPAKKTAKRR